MYREPVQVFRGSQCPQDLQDSLMGTPRCKLMLQVDFWMPTLWVQIYSSQLQAVWHWAGYVLSVCIKWDSEH
jgi:hypothetical protein